MNQVNAVALELLNHALSSITDEMMITMNRTGYSYAVQYLMDFSAALFDAEGEMIVQGIATPHHLGAMPTAIESIRRRFVGSIEPGDVFIMNDPYAGGIHLPDIFMFKPAFADEKLLGFACLMTHHVDVGGRVPGSMAADSRSIHEEGIRLPPLKLYARGTPNDAVFEIIAHNTRLPDVVLGDLRAQLAACTIGERGLKTLASRHGEATLRLLFAGLRDQAEQIVRQTILSIPDGRYEFTDYVDDDGVTDQPLRIHVALTIAGDHLDVDFTGSSPQTAGAINCITALTSVCTVLRCVLPPDTPNNAGAIRPISVNVPLGTFLNPRYPAACAARGPTAYRVDDAVFGALSKAMPGRIPAASDGGNSSLRIAGLDAEGRRYILTEIVCGSRGGRPHSDGIEGACNPQQNISNTPVEVVEADYPVRVIEYGFVPDSGGPGRYRGGLALVREWEFLGDEVTLQVRSDRRNHQPWGAAGGRSGTGSDCILDPRTEQQQRLPAKFVRTVKKGQHFRHIIPGGGGYGDPLERDPENVARDLRDQKLTIEYAKREYGVVIDPERRVDLRQTDELRRRLRESPQKEVTTAEN